MFRDKRNLLILVLCTVIAIFAFLSYRQNQTIDVLNREIIMQAKHRHKLFLENYSLSKELDSGKADSLDFDKTKKDQHEN